MDDGVTPLSIASANGNVEVVRLLVGSGAAVDLPSVGACMVFVSSTVASLISYS